jgi:hypothetical protein
MNDDIRTHYQLLKKKLLNQNKTLLIDYILGYLDNNDIYFMELCLFGSKDNRDEIVKFVNRLINSWNMPFKYIEMIKIKKEIDDEYIYLRLLIGMIEERITNYDLLINLDEWSSTHHRRVLYY